MSEEAKPTGAAPANPDSKTKPDLDPEVEKQLKEAADSQDELAVEMRDRCQLEFNKRASLLSDDFNHSFNSQMSNIGDRYTSHTHDRVTTQQTGILKVNKVFRDVSRDLGADWKPVFQHLMKDHDEQKMKVEMARIERQKPFMQPFKALNQWKDAAGDKFDLRNLTQALMSIDRRDLAEKVMDILDNNELDSLYAMDGVGSGIAGGAALRRPPSKIEEGAATTNGTDKPAERKPVKPPPAATEDPIGDRALLKIAKAVDKDWFPLAQALELSEEDLSDCKESGGGDSYHGGFKALFTWRDNQIEAGKLTQESSQDLKEALKKVGKADLANSINAS